MLTIYTELALSRDDVQFVFQYVTGKKTRTFHAGNIMKLSGLHNIFSNKFFAVDFRLPC